MPKIAKAKSAGQLARIKKPGLHSVGGVPGLQLQVTPTGARSWILRVQVGTKRRDVGLGSFGDVTLAEARERARSVKASVWEGKDPVAERKALRAALIAQQAKTLTFGECATQYISAHRDGWRNVKHAAQWASTLDTYAAPINKLSVASIDTALVMRCIEPEWATKTETMSRVRGRIERVLAWATVRGYRTGDNPAQWRGHLDELLPKRAKVAKVEHRAAIPYAEAGAFMAELRHKRGMAARALEFQALTATRPGEACGALWAEFDLDAGLWIIPPERMKAGKEHRVPLSPPALAMLRKLPHAGPAVFPGTRGGPVSTDAAMKVLKALRPGMTAHGLRSTFRDWAGEATAFPRETIEQCMAHRLKDKAEAAYSRGDSLAKRKRVMDAWADYLSQPARGATVTGIHQKAKA